MLKFIRYSRKKKNLPVNWEFAPDIEKRAKKIFDSLNYDKGQIGNIYFFRSYNSKARAYARIWGLPKVWQKALKINPSYVIEVISENFDNLSGHAKDDVIIHEIAHIPKTFSGSLVPHFRRGKRKFSKKVDTLISAYSESKRK